MVGIKARVCRIRFIVSGNPVLADDAGELLGEDEPLEWQLAGRAYSLHDGVSGLLVTGRTLTATNIDRLPRVIPMRRGLLLAAWTELSDLPLVETPNACGVPVRIPRELSLVLFRKRADSLRIRVGSLQPAAVVSANVQLQLRAGFPRGHSFG